MFKEVRLSRRQTKIVYEPGLTQLDCQCRLLGLVGVDAIAKGFLDEHGRSIAQVFGLSNRFSQAGLSPAWTPKFLDQ